VRQISPPNIKDGLVEVVAAADINPEALANAQEHLGLRADQCYTDIQRAFDENRADFCAIVVPPVSHEMVVDLALAHEMHILSEKPIADTLLASMRIADKVKRAGKKMGVTMSHRFDQDKTTLRQELCSGRHGALDYLVCRFTCDCRQFGTWGVPAMRFLDALLVEGRCTTWIFWRIWPGRCVTRSMPKAGIRAGANTPVIRRRW
jgi:predicted dehydrogenase